MDAPQLVHVVVPGAAAAPHAVQFTDLPSVHNAHDNYSWSILIIRRQSRKRQFRD